MDMDAEERNALLYRWREERWQTSETKRELDLKHQQKKQELQTKGEVDKELYREQAKLDREQRNDAIYAEYKGRLSLELMNQHHKELNRPADFEDHKKRELLGLQLRQVERLEQARIDDERFYRQLLELQAQHNNRIIELMTLAQAQRVQSQQEHQQTLEREALGHYHRLIEANNGSRLKREELTHQRILDYILGNMGASDSLSRADLDDLVKQWEAEGDQLKR